jgi:hypothetical protein
MRLTLMCVNRFNGALHGLSPVGTSLHSLRRTI